MLRLARSVYSTVNTACSLCEMDPRTPRSVMRHVTMLFPSVKIRTVLQERDQAGVHAHLSPGLMPKIMAPPECERCLTHVEESTDVHAMYHEMVHVEHMAGAPV